jgi:hypothetical protein
MDLKAHRKLAYNTWYVVARTSQDIRLVMRARLTALSVDRMIAQTYHIPGAEVYDIKIERITKAVNSLPEGASLDITRDYCA